MFRAWIAQSERIAAWVAGVAGILLAVPILAARYPPMGDLAMHEGLVAILRHLHDPSWVPSGLYYPVVPQANQLFPLAALALSFILPTDIACKLLVATIVAVTPPLTARLLAKGGRSRWLALLVGPIACGWMFRWGLVANLSGFALLLFSLPELERLARRPVLAAIARSTGCVCALFFAHESSAIIFGGVAAAFALVRSRTWRGFAARVTPAVATLALVLVQWRVSDRLLGANMRNIGTEYGADPLDRLAILPGGVFGGLSSGRLALVSGLWLATIASSALLRRGRSEGGLPLAIALWRHRYAVLAAGLAFLYLVFPMAIGGTTLLAHRFLPAACVCLLVACAGAGAGTGAKPHAHALTAALAAASPLVTLAVELPAFVASDARYRALDRVIARMPRDVAVAQLDLTPRIPGHIAPVVGATGRVLAERGGRMLFAMTDTPPNPVYIRRGLSWNEPVQRLVQTPYAFMPSYDFTRFSYLLERNESEPARALVARALTPEAELVLEDGEWTLFRSRLPVVDLVAPDRSLPSPAPETLGARVGRAQAASAAAPVLSSSPPPP
jgi:hypothetical protein